MAIALVLTRQPFDPFTFKTGVADDPKKMRFAIETGRFGTLIVLEAGSVTEVQLLKGKEQGATSVIVPGGRLEIAYSGGLREVARYTTIERTDHNMVILPPQPNPYFATYEPNNPNVRQLTETGGRCFRVLGGHTLAQLGILIHAAPHVGWLEGCISPRKLGDKALETRSTFFAMLELYQIIGNYRAPFFVTDWDK